MIMRMRKLPDGRIKILTQGLCKANIQEFTQTNPFFEVKIDRIPEIELLRKPSASPKLS